MRAPTDKRHNFVVTSPINCRLTITHKEYVVKIIKDPSLAEWRFKEVDGELAVCGYKGSDTDIVIPSHACGRRVTRVANRAFAEKDGIFGVTVPEGITHIGNEAFWECEGLARITLPKGLRVIGNSSFVLCRGLTEIVLPSGLTEIGRNAFVGCRSLKRIRFSQGLKEIKAWAFSGCISLETVTLPEGLVTLGAEVFVGCSELTEITFPSTVTQMGEGLFAGNKSLKKAILPCGITSIGKGAFHDCYGLSEIDIPHTVTRIEDLAFMNCKSLAEIKLPAAIEDIGEVAFACTAITEIDIPDGVRVGNEAFGHCSRLKTVFADGENIKFGTHTFRACRNIEEFRVSVSSAAHIDRYDASSEEALYVMANGSRDYFNYFYLTEKAVRYFFSRYESGKTTEEEQCRWAEYLKKRLPRSNDSLRSDPAAYELMEKCGVLKQKDIDDILAVTESAECRAILLRCGQSQRDGGKRKNNRKYTL